MIDKIKSQKDSESLIEDITIIIDRYHAFSSSSKSSILHNLICNVYKCLTLAISLYITKCSSPLPKYMYRVKHSMEKEILSEEFLNTDKPTYEWLIDTFQYAADIPIDIPNSRYTQESSKQVGVTHNIGYVIFNKLALLVGNKTIPFTIDFNSSPVGYHRYLTPGIKEKLHYTMAELIAIQTLKVKANSSIIYTLFEEAFDEKLKRLLTFKTPVSFMDIAEKLRESIRVLEVLDSKYIKHLTIKGENDNIKDTLQTN
ncbi:MAG: hypothetical protein LR001_09250 [Clostridiales bacterium]|nr:hypothetical protein [Clostridiales bacterium]